VAHRVLRLSRRGPRIPRRRHSLFGPSRRSLRVALDDHRVSSDASQVVLSPCSLSASAHLQSSTSAPLCCVIVDVAEGRVIPGSAQLFLHWARVASRTRLLRENS
jgi:hypothetical protein